MVITANIRYKACELDSFLTTWTSPYGKRIRSATIALSESSLYFGRGYFFVCVDVPHLGWNGLAVRIRLEIFAAGLL